ncbi:MAG: PstS family phosphate ABC transporter substrate-binding protein [Solirubrobacterales bacterium]
MPARNRFNAPLTLIATIVAVLALAVTGCGDDDDKTASGGGSDLSGSITIDGSSTVFPFAQAAAEGFKEGSPNVKTTVGESGTGGGFEKFCAGETDISNASRPIKDEEIEICEKNGVKYRELQVANDGIAVVTNPALAVDCLTTDELKKIWDKGSKVKSLSEVKDGAPDAELSLFGPGTDSGTFDYFTDEINGEEGRSRSDYQPSEDDNVLVEGVAGDDGGMGYFGFSYYEQNSDKLNLVGVDSGSGCVKPSSETIQDGSYKPLARPIFMYVSEEALAKEQVKSFLTYSIDEHTAVSELAEIVPMSEEQATKAKETLDAAA